MSIPHWVIPSSLRSAIRKKLLAWYDSYKRDLPWRHRYGDPYAQWVAEVMLQQTRVDTVLRYYDRFLSRFPDVATLAAARHEDVLKFWEGLGYYRRILHLHQACRDLHERADEIPRCVDGLRQLPGVGGYTAAAIASIAFGERAAAVDGNVARVVSRLLGIRDDVTMSAGKALVQGAADQLLPTARPGDFNQAWMDLGSGICTPRAPNCPACPLAVLCVAAKTGCTEQLPVRDAGRNGKVRAVAMLTAVFVSRGRVLVRRRPVGGLWSGLWELPSCELGADGHGRAFRRLAENERVTIIGRPTKVGNVLLRLTHRALQFHVHTADVEPVGKPSRGDRRWVRPEGFSRLAVSTAHRRIWASWLASSDVWRKR